MQPSLPAALFCLPTCPSCPPFSLQGRGRGGLPAAARLAGAGVAGTQGAGRVRQLAREARWWGHVQHVRTATPAPPALQPVHAQRSKGLRGGASPLLLPDAPQQRRGGGGQACSLLEPAAPPPGSSQLDHMLPSEDVLRRSEFLLPLDRDTAALYRRLLRA